MVCAERSRRRPSHRQLVVRRIAEADGKRLHRARRVLRHEREHGRRVEPAAEEGAERHVRPQPDAHRLVELCTEPFEVLRLGDLHLARVRPRPVRDSVRLVVRRDDQRRARVEPGHAGENRAVTRHVAERQKLE